MEWKYIKDEKPYNGQQILIYDGNTVYYAVKRDYEGYEYQIAEDFDLNEEKFETNAIQEKGIVKWMPIECSINED